MNFHHAMNYLKYLVFSGHRKGHGIHSPFIFDIVSGMFRNKNNKDVVFSIEKIRKKLISDNRIINVNDLGAGRDRKNSKSRKVSDIAKRSAVPRKYGILLSGLAAEFGSPSVIELGTSLGISAMYLASACPGVVHTIEGCGECADIASANFKNAGMDIELHKGSFEQLLPHLLDSGIKPGFVFIDGNHRKEAVLKYFSELLSVSDEKMVIAIDDIHSSKEMSDAWNEIRHYKNVSATIDIFRMGLVFFKKGITRNHYIIRY